ncbi:MAG TPA: Trm112 family protein [Terracidiphilus sp.]|jgi:hypothetical protein|nr:Trm112 family protein [Terracidiphilus sp.]
MKTKPDQSAHFDVSIVNELACPVCFGELRLDPLSLVCAGCGRGYPVIDGIPVLIAERALVPPPQ